MKRKLLIFSIVSAMALSMVACGASEDTKVIEASSNGADEVEATAQNNEGYVFHYDGTELKMDADAAPIVEKLGEPGQYFESPSCAAEGIGKLYTYSDFEIQTYPDGDVDRILYVRLRTDNVATDEGIDLSSTREDIVAAYGEPAEEATGSMTYELGGTSLIFIFDGDTLNSIEYDSAMNK